MREIRTSGLMRGRLPAFGREPLYSTQKITNHLASMIPSNMGKVLSIHLTESEIPRNFRDAGKHILN